jgi:hypothetical protein
MGGCIDEWQATRSAGDVIRGGAWSAPCWTGIPDQSAEEGLPLVRFRSGLEQCLKVSSASHPRGAHPPASAARTGLVVAADGGALVIGTALAGRAGGYAGG